MRYTAAIAAALLALAACKKEQPPPPPAAPAQEEPAAHEASAPAAEPAEEKIAVDEPLVAKYIAYQKELLVIIREQMAKLHQAAAAADTDSTTSTLNAANKMANASEEMAAREKALLNKHGLTEAQVTAVQEVVGGVIPGRVLMGGAGGQKAIVQQMREGLKDAPAGKRAEAEAEIAKMEKSIDDLFNAVEARERHGAAAVDAVLKHEQELTALQADALKSLGGK